MSENEEKKDRVIYITHKGELLFWLIIILFFAFGLFLFHLKNAKSSDNSFNIFLPDVDGLIVGSPVRIMGIEVGHVTKIKPVGDEVFVKFIIKNKDIKIPRGTEATVEFSGMAGSKSLELYVPEQNKYIDKNTPLLEVSPPKRLHDAFGLLNEMFKTLGSIITKTSIFMKEVNSIELPNAGNPENLEDFLNFSNKALDESTKRLQNMERKLENYGKK